MRLVFQPVLSAVFLLLLPEHVPSNSTGVVNRQTRSIRMISGADHDEEMGSIHQMYAFLDVEFEIQRPMKDCGVVLGRDSKINFDGL